MKKLLLTTLLLTTLLLTACNGNESQTTPSKSSTGEISSTETPKEPSAQEAIALPKVTITHKQDYEYAEDGTTLLLESGCDVVKLEGEGFEAAAQTIDALFAESVENSEEYISTVKEDYEYSKSNGEEYFAPYSSLSTSKISRMDRNIFSLKCMSSDYFGGAHGLWGYWGITLDMQTGKELELTDLAVDSYALIETCTDYALKNLADRKDELFPEYESYVEENLSNCNWYMDASGIVFVFTPYEIGPYASGCIEICVPYSQVAEYMKPEYCGIQGDCIALIQGDEPVSFTTTDNKTRQLSFETKMTSEYDFRTTLKVDKEKHSLGDNVALETAYLMHNADGKTFLLYTVDWASDDYETYVYDLTGNNMVQTANIWACLNSRSMGTNTLSLEFRLNVLGTYFADMEYNLTENGELEPLEEIYQIETSAARTGLTTIKELPVIIDNEKKMLPVGSRIYIVATDNEGTIWFETPADKGEFQSGLIQYVRDAESYHIFIDGVVEDEYFDMLPYVG